MEILRKVQLLKRQLLQAFKVQKKTADLIPMCHPLFLSGVDLDVQYQEECAILYATVCTSGKTGVEMEALTAVSIASPDFL